MPSTTPIELTVPCRGCGPVGLPLDDVTLWRTRDDQQSWLTVRCPACGSRFVHRTAPGEHLLLLACDVPVRHWEPPSERVDASAVATPIGPGEVEAFASTLSGDDLLAALVPPWG